MSKLLESQDALIGDGRNSALQRFRSKAAVIWTFIGMLFVGKIINSLIIIAPDVSEQMMIWGGLIILAVAFGCRPSMT